MDHSPTVKQPGAELDRIITENMDGQSSLESKQPQTYSQAVMGNPDLMQLSPPVQCRYQSSEDQQDTFVTTDSSTSSNKGTCTVSANGGSVSGSVTNPIFPFLRKNRSESFSGNSMLPLLSPLSPRQKTSKASSNPNLDKVLMSREDNAAGDNGFSSLPVLSSPSNSSFLQYLSPPNDSSSVHKSMVANSRGNSCPTLADMVGIDLAVARAAQNLQKLQQQQAAMYSGLGVVGVSSTASPILEKPQPVERNSEPKSNTLSSILASISQFPDQQVSRGLSGFPFHFQPSLQHPAQAFGLSDPLALEKAARLYRSAASVYEATCTWSGQLPPRTSIAGPNSSYSNKIFLGGVPWDISEGMLVDAFAEFGEVRVEWPGRNSTSAPRGFLYLVFPEERDVVDLLAKCSQDFNTRDSYYYKISSRRMRSKEVQIIPWVLADSSYVRCPSPRLDPQKTVFVGALHGMMTAQGVAVIFNDLFGGVVHAGLDTDKYKYPIGSGRVTFNNSRSYMKAVAAAFVEIKTPRFCKKIQVDPYLEDTQCSLCGLKSGPFFCRDLGCFDYFCHGCWILYHTNSPHHKPIMRNIRGVTRVRSTQQNYSDHNVRRFHQDPVSDLTEQFSQTFGLRG